MNRFLISLLCIVSCITIFSAKAENFAIDGSDGITDFRISEPVISGDDAIFNVSCIIRRAAGRNMQICIDVRDESNSTPIKDRATSQDLLVCKRFQIDDNLYLVKKSISIPLSKFKESGLSKFAVNAWVYADDMKKYISKPTSIFFYYPSSDSDSSALWQEYAEKLEKAFKSPNFTTEFCKNNYLKYVTVERNGRHIYIDGKFDDRVNLNSISAEEKRQLANDYKQTFAQSSEWAICSSLGIVLTITLTDRNGKSISTTLE